MTALAAAMLVLSVVLRPADLRLARIVQGEAGICERSARLAVAYICSRNGTCYGDATPDAESLDVARSWRSEPDPTDGKAMFVLSDQDMELAHVREMVGEHVRSWECAGGLSLHAYAALDK